MDGFRLKRVFFSFLYFLMFSACYPFLSIFLIVLSLLIKFSVRMIIMLGLCVLPLFMISSLPIWMGLCWVWALGTQDIRRDGSGGWTDGCIGWVHLLSCMEIIPASCLISVERCVSCRIVFAWTFDILSTNHTYRRLVMINIKVARISAPLGLPLWD